MGFGSFHGVGLTVRANRSLQKGTTHNLNSAWIDGSQDWSITYGTELCEHTDASLSLIVAFTWKSNLRERSKSDQRCSDRNQSLGNDFWKQRVMAIQSWILGREWVCTKPVNNLIRTYSPLNGSYKDRMSNTMHTKATFGMLSEHRSNGSDWQWRHWIINNTPWKSELIQWSEMYDRKRHGVWSDLWVNRCCKRKSVLIEWHHAYVWKQTVNRKDNAIEQSSSRVLHETGLPDLRKTNPKGDVDPKILSLRMAKFRGTGNALNVILGKPWLKKRIEDKYSNTCETSVLGQSPHTNTHCVFSKDDAISILKALVER